MPLLVSRKNKHIIFNFPKLEKIIFSEIKFQLRILMEPFKYEVI